MPECRWHPRSRQPPTAGRHEAVRQFHEGLRFVVVDTLLRVICLASAAFQFSFAAVMTAYLIFLTRELHLSGGAVGLALAATGPGALVGSLLAARLPSRFGYGAVLVSAAAVGDGVLLFVPALHGPSAVAIPLLIAVNFVYGTFGQLVNVTVMAVRQAVTPDWMQGRAAATITFVGMGLSPLGSLLGRQARLVREALRAGRRGRTEAAGRRILARPADRLRARHVPRRRPAERPQGHRAW
ncbi:MAG TPA: MFS transporter [Dactylosporangium sp.]|jgi:predicted MFS family arabinose efflux permease|nr:MFS transporter [Dactylosporangium sp.]